MHDLVKVAKNYDWSSSLFNWQRIESLGFIF